MKVHIKKPRHWISVYSFLEKVFFWKDIYGEDGYVDKIADWLQKPFEILNKVLDFFHGKDNIRIDDWDTWDADHTLGMIILPTLKKVFEYKGVSAHIEDEDVPEELRRNGAENFEKMEKQWEYVTGEIIFAFESLFNDWESNYYSGKASIDWAPIEGSNLFQLVKKEDDTFKVDMEGMREYQKRIDNGFKLFGTYYQCFWT